MAMLTPLSLPEARALCATWSLEVQALDPILHGSVNSNFALTLAGGDRAFLRVYEESTFPEVEVQNRLLAHLVRGGLATPAPLARRGGGTVSEHAEKPVCVFPFVAGQWLCQARVEARHLRRIGAFLGRLHRLGERYPEPPRNRFDATALGARLAEVRERPLEASLGRDVERLAGALASLGPPGAATTVVHGDLFRDNVLWHEDELAAVIDFESASAGHPAFDLMVTALAWCFGDRLEEPLVRALGEGYREERALSDQDLAHCFDAARAAAIRFAITRITDYELRPRHLVAYKDYRRFVARLEAVEALGAVGLAGWLSSA